MNDYTNLLKSFLVIVSMALCAAGHAQELCANGIDDDGDGLIDIQDVADCGCSAASTILLQSSFETNSCCPTDRNYSTLIDCLGEGWLTPTGSADYFHTCGFMGDSFSPAVPLPMPSGNGVMGIATFTEFLGSPFPFYESLANCLNSPMTSGETHGISFYLGFGTPAQQLYISTLNTTLALYGKTSCTDLWMGDDDCMTNYGWELITEIPVSAGSEGTWVFVDHTFVPSSDYAAIGIAMTCGDYPVNQYHFIDEVIITGPDQGPSLDDPLVLGVSGDCIEGVTIAVLNGAPNADYQWYLDGVAISGATSNPLLVTDAAADGVYQVMMTTARGCQISDPLPVQINENALIVNGLVTDINCSSEEIGSINLSVNSNNLPLTFDWDSGDTSEFIAGLAPGEYHVTVTDANGCVGTNSFSILASPPLEISPSFAEITCSNPATDITIGVLGGSPPFDFLWSNGSTNASLTSVGAGLYEVTVSDANGCSDQTSVEITGVSNPIFIDITAPAMLSCFATSVVLDGSSSTPSDGVTYSWTTPNGMLVGATDEAIASAGAPGDYTLLVTDIASNCSTMETVTVTANTTPPVAEAGSSMPFGCGDTQLQLNGSGSSVADVAYHWSTTDGTIVSGAATLDPIIGAAGTYTLEVTHLGNGCSATDEVIVLEDDVLPIVQITVNDTLDCATNTMALNASGSSSGAGFTLAWSTNGGHFMGGTDGLLPTVDQPGTYTLDIVNTASGCVNSTSVTVLQDTIAPTAVIAPPLQLTCTENVVLLDGSASTGTADLSYNWSSTTGSLMGNTAADRANATQAGVYQLVVTNTVNGCSDTTATVVMQDDNFPSASIAMPLALTCAWQSVVLSGTASSNSGNTTFTWATMDGNIVQGANTLQPVVDAPGTYILTVEDLGNNCQTQAAVEVVLDDTPPVAEAGSSTPFGCGDTQLQLNGSGSSVADVAYQWSTTDGTIISGAATLGPIIGAAGTYTLEVTHLGNGCSATDEVIVLEDDVLPIVQITVNDTLDCATNTMALNASGSSSGAGFTLAWSTNGGHFMGGTDGFFPTVDQPGTYTLDIVNTASGCVNSASVTVLQDTIAPVAVILPPVALNCLVTSQVLDGANSSQGGNIQYQWTTVNGQITSGQNTASAGIDAPGDYQLLVENTGNGCTATTAVTVTENVAIPGFSIPPVGELNCLHESRLITANLDTPIPNPVFQWSTLDGVILGSDTTAQIVASRAGTYTVTVQNPANFCSGTGSVQLTSNSVLPIAEAGMDQVINCMTGTQTLGGNSSAGNTITHHWSSPDAALLVVDSLATLVVNTAGTYILEVLDTSNGCSATDTVQVIENFQAPTAVIAPPLPLTCTENVVLLDGSASTGTAGLSYSWSSTTGSLMGNTAADRANATQAGVYQLVVTNSVNGCSDTTATVVTQDDNFPLASIAMPLVLTCGRQSVVLSGTANSNSGNTSFTWATTDGNIVQGANTLQPVVDEPGTYTLTVEDLGNNCQTQAVVEVLLDDTPPVAEAGDDFQMDCMEPNHLDGSQSSQGSHITYRWTAQSGAVLLGENTLQPTISAPDTYQLVVTNIHNGCTATDVVVVAQNVPVATLNVIQPPCYGDDGEIAFNSVQGGTPPYTYSINAGAAFQAQPLFGHLAEGVYEVLVEDSNGCTFAETVAIIQPDSLYVFFTEQRVGIDYGDSVQLIARTNLPEASFTEINWDDAATLSCSDCLTPYARPTETTMYHIQVVSENGCAADAWINVLVNRQFPVYFPNAFSPNNDGVNDIFYPIAELGSVTNIHQFHIFDRWGTAVYSGNDFAANDPRHGWDGTKAGEKMNPAVFVYFAEIEFADGRIDIFKGDVMLIR